MPKISDIQETPNPNAVKFILREVGTYSCVDHALCRRLPDRDKPAVARNETGASGRVAGVLNKRVGPGKARAKVKAENTTVKTAAWLSALFGTA